MRKNKHFLLIKLFIGIAIVICGIFLLGTCGNQASQVSDPPQLPLVAVTFDDGDTTNFTKGFRILKEYNSRWSATMFVCGAYPWGGIYLNTSQLHEMQANGWEIGARAYTHEHLAEFPMDSVVWQVNSVYDFLVKNNFSHESFAYPYGSCNAKIRSVVRSKFHNIRGSADAHYPDGVDPTDLGYYPVYNNNTVSDICNRVNEARVNGEPLVIIGFHVILPDSAYVAPGARCKESTYRGFLDYLKKNNLRACSIRDAIDELQKRNICKSLTRSIQCGY